MQTVYYCVWKAAWQNIKPSQSHHRPSSSTLRCMHERSRVMCTQKHACQCLRHTNHTQTCTPMSEAHEHAHPCPRHTKHTKTYTPMSEAHKTHTNMHTHVQGSILSDSQAVETPVLPDESGERVGFSSEFQVPVDHPGDVRMVGLRVVCNPHSSGADLTERWRMKGQAQKSWDPGDHELAGPRALMESYQQLGNSVCLFLASRLRRVFCIQLNK